MLVLGFLGLVNNRLCCRILQQAFLLSASLADALECCHLLLSLISYQHLADERR